MDDPASEISATAKGGLWNDENLSKPLEWLGEKAKIPENDSPQQTSRQSRKEERTEILKEANMSIEAIRAMSETVEERILQSSGFASGSLKGAMHSIARESEERLREWVQSTMAATETSNKEPDSQVQGLSERLSTLEHKLDELLRATVNRDATELDIVREAATIVVEKRREDAETGETPSEVHRMELRTEDLESRLKRLQQITIPNASRTSTTKEEKRKKLSKLF